MMKQFLIALLISVSSSLSSALVYSSCRDAGVTDGRKTIEIDLDGAGPLKPFPARCKISPDRILTLIGHSSEHSTLIDGYQEHGSYEIIIKYTAGMEEIEALIERSRSCVQKLSYSCRLARLFNSPSDAKNFKPFGWWISRQNKTMDYWAGSKPGSRKCACGMESNCIDPKKWCNCDANRYDWQEDAGQITEKEFLPVRSLRFGDTGSHGDEKEAKFTLGPLVCEGEASSDSAKRIEGNSDEGFSIWLWLLLLLIILLILIILVVSICYCRNHQKGAYLTSEDKGTEKAQNINEAFLKSVIGPPAGKKEYYM